MNLTFKADGVYAEPNLVFKSFKLWLSGYFVCRICGKEYNLYSFGFGEIICPICYQGDIHFVFLDNNYWLNRIIDRKFNQKSKPLLSFSEPAFQHPITPAPIIS